jgi:hypothetical protein
MKYKFAASAAAVFSLLLSSSPALSQTGMLSGVSQRIDTCSRNAIKLPAQIQVLVNGSWRTVASATHSEKGGYEDSYCGGSYPFDSWGMWTPNLNGKFKIRLLESQTGRGYPSLGDGTLTLTGGASNNSGANSQVQQSPFIAVPSFAGSGLTMNDVKNWFATSGFKGSGYFRVENGYQPNATSERLGECHITRQDPHQGMSVMNSPSTSLVFYTTC